nr:chalcone isomerase family protein [uncultured Roseateles sp.]
MRVFLIAAAMGLLLPLTSPALSAETVEVAGVKYESPVNVNGNMIELNGAGVRYKAVFKVYTAGLYLGKKTDDIEVALSSNVPKRLHLTMLREVDAAELGRLFTKGMEQNATREEFGKAINGVLRVGEIFSSRKGLAVGEHFSVDYIPGTGSVIQLNGKVQGAPIREPEFYSAFLRIWLGKSPADQALKEALMGIKREARGRN